MNYLVHKTTKEHRHYADAIGWSDAECYLVNADPDGWIEWPGGECPLPDGVRFDAKMRDGMIALDEPPIERAAWRHEWGEADIIAYRPILDTKVSHPGTMAGPDKCRSDGGEWPAWDGVGMPRTGALACTSGGDCKVVTTDAARGQVCVRWHDGELGVVPIGAVKPRPIRSEEDRITEEFERIMYKPAMTREMAARIYEAVRDGKVPGVKLAGGE